MTCGEMSSNVYPADPDCGRRRLTQMKWESGESIYGIDNNRESAALLYDETGGTRSRQPRPGSRGAAFREERTLGRSNPVDS